MRFTTVSSVSAAGLMVFGLPAAAPAASTTFVKTYANFSNTQQQDVTPEAVQSTFDGGYILLAATGAVNWLIKTDSSGNPQWQKELGCLSAPPGDYTIGVSIQQTTDGGYIVGGGAIGCGQPPFCGGLLSTQCAIAEKLDAEGNPVWAGTYSPNTGFTSIRQTADGGYVAAGGAYPSPKSGLVLKLDGEGNVQWQREIGPDGSNTVWFQAIRQTSDGGFVATGTYYISGSQDSALAVKLDAGGNVQWQEELKAPGSDTLFTDSIVPSSDGGYVAAGAWFGSQQKGGLVVKLDAVGKILWQNAYSGGTYCHNGSCVELGVVIYSVEQTADGGYLLAGDGEDKLQEGGRLVPWLGRIDSSGKLLWERFYYQIYAPTGRALSQYFVGSDVAKGGGFVAAGWTEDYAVGLGLLFLVKTDGSGLCGRCGDVHPDVGLTAVDPGLTISPLSLPVGTTVTPGTASPGKTRATGIQSKKDC